MCFAMDFFKEFGRNDFKALRIGVLITLVVGGLFLFTNWVSADNPFTDFFDTYEIGNLAGQGDWATTTPPYFYAQTTTTDYQSHPISASWISSEPGSISKQGTQIANGSWSFWVKISSDPGNHYEWSNIAFKGGGLTPTYLRFECWDTGEPSDCEDSGTIFVKRPAPLRTTFCEIPLDEWINFQTQWTSTTDVVKWKCGDDDWIEDIRGDFEYIDRFEIQTSNDTGLLQFYLDSVGSGTCDDDNCGLCEIYSTCINANCSWYYSIYLQDYYCVDLFEPDPNECGSFYSCQYCSTQSACEAELNCSWTDIGYGLKCYFTDPIIPPDPIEWEIPDLEDCGLLSGTELWLCQIQNLITGAVMPSQEKVSALYQTFGAFKEKFPFNYVGSFNEFFTAIIESFDEEKPVPIRVLGVETDVNFSFWNTTTTIGGQGETFKNVLFDFSTMAILIVWFVWLMSWIKRFF